MADEKAQEQTRQEEATMGRRKRKRRKPQGEPMPTHKTNNGKGIEQPMAAVAGETAAPAKRARPPKPTTILGADPPLTPVAPAPEPEALASVGVEIDVALAELTENQRKARQAKEQPLRVAQRPLLEALAAKEQESRRVTLRFKSLPSKLTAMRSALERQWSAGESCQRLLREVARLIGELESLLPDPVEEIRKLITTRTLDDFRPELRWPQGPQPAWNRIASLDLREEQIEEKYAKVSRAFQELCSRYGAEPVKSLKRMEPVLPEQEFAATEYNVLDG